MSTMIRTTCPTCGPVLVGPEEIVVETVPDTAQPIGPDSRWMFHCPVCGERVTRRANQRITRLLGGAGAAVTTAHDAPASPVQGYNGHPEFPPPGPPLNHDDLLDLHLLLEADGWFERLAAMTPD